MRRLRILVVLLIFWLLLLFSVERFVASINISHVAYAFVPLVALLILLIRPLKPNQLWIFLSAAIPLFMLLKALAGYEVISAGLPMTVTELCAISITALLAYWISNGLGEFEEAVAHITIGSGEETISERMRGQAEMYREVRRARRYQRPLTLLTIGVDEGSIQVALDRIVREAQEALLKRQMLSDVARSLCDQLEDYNLITQQVDRFMILLPEIAPERTEEVIEELKRDIAIKVGVELKFGVAHFPSDAVTFESLVEKANREVSSQLNKKVFQRPLMRQKDYEQPAIREEADPS
jgi:hypothetical protein